MQLTTEFLADRLGPDRHASRLVVAFSGGVDSTVLLHALSEMGQADARMHLTAVHVDHGLQADSAEWSRHCERIAKTYGVRYCCHRVEVSAGHVGLEAGARDARYELLRKVVGPGDCLLTAHHEDDQFETVLLQLMRGAGPAGLAAMPGRARFGRGWQLRPLLGVSRASIIRYAGEHGLDYLEDPANDDMRFDRSWLRRNIMPRLAERWPRAGRAVARSAAHVASASRLLDVLGGIDAGGEATLQVKSLSGLGRERRANALRLWLKQRRLPTPSTAQLNAVLDEVIPARDDANPCVAWPGAEVRRYRGRLHALIPMTPAGPGRELTPRPGAPCAFDLPGPNGRLWLIPHTGRGISAEKLLGATIEVRYRRGGERIRPAGSAHSRELKTLFQERGVLPWTRDHIPIIFVDGEPAAVAGFWVTAAFTASSGAQGLRVFWETPMRVC